MFKSQSINQQPITQQFQRIQPTPKQPQQPIIQQHPITQQSNIPQQPIISQQPKQSNIPQQPSGSQQSKIPFIQQQSIVQKQTIQPILQQQQQQLVAQQPSTPQQSTIPQRPPPQQATMNSFLKRTEITEIQSSQNAQKVQAAALTNKVQSNSATENIDSSQTVNQEPLPLVSLSQLEKAMLTPVTKKNQFVQHKGNNNLTTTVIAVNNSNAAISQKKNVSFEPTSFEIYEDNAANAPNKNNNDPENEHWAAISSQFLQSQTQHGNASNRRKIPGPIGSLTIEELQGLDDRKNLMANSNNNGNNNNNNNNPRLLARPEEDDASTTPKESDFRKMAWLTMLQKQDFFPLEEPHRKLALTSTSNSGTFFGVSPLMICRME